MREENYLHEFENLFNELKIPLTQEVSGLINKIVTETCSQQTVYLKNFISRLSIPALIINNKGIILNVNSRFTETFGFKEADIADSPLSLLVPNSQKELFSEIMTDIAKGKEIPEQEIKLQKKDGITATSGFTAFSPNPDDDISVVLLRDFSAIKKLEKELTKSRVKLQKSEQFKSVFLANMSHEIRTPMNAIIGFSELINMEGISQDKRKDYSKIINQRGQLLLTLIDDIIEITKIESGRITLDYTWIELDEFMNDLYSMIFQQKVKEGKDNVEIILEKQEDASGFRMFTDPGRLHQIFLNLLQYFVRTISKGNISFGYHLQEKEIEFFLHNSSTYFSSEEQKLLFEHFWKIEDTTHLKIKGAGLGLTIAKSLIEQFGGKINVQSESQSGTTFTFRLPLVIPQQSDKNATESFTHEELQVNNTDPNWKSKVILVVEDDLINYQFIEALLEKTQVQLLHAENGHQALELCKNINKIDLILMDIKLPEKNGYEITREIKSFRKDIPIIAQTAFSMNDVKERCFESGCTDIILKPVDIDIFISKLNKYLT